MPKVQIDTKITEQPATNADIFPLTNDLLSSQQGYKPITCGQKIQSNAYVTDSDINSLVAAAAPIFSILKKLRHTQKNFSLDKLQDILIHEIQAFESNAQRHDYPYDTILIARYAICATLDEVIMRTAWGDEWSEKTLLSAFQTEHLGSDGFFTLLERLLQAPKQHIDLLEFMYACLSLGFTGKFKEYKNENETQDELENEPEIDTDALIDKLYHTIREQRGDFRRALSPPVRRPVTAEETITNTQTIPVWLVAALAFCVMLTLYIGYGYILKLTQAPLYQTLAALNINTATTSPIHSFSNIHIK